ncbi:MAG: phosphocholine cytidylyltransferase family protein, partial [Bacteroidaceae bacterium]|nr:phosphocholine cytidylyltransferase family protein [Bacteroidaceae bacterium]
MQAIILAAGMGKRLGTLTKENTKCMVRVNGIALIDRLLTQLTAVGLRRVVIVTGYQGEKLRNFIGSRYDEAFPIEYVDNPDYAHTNNIYSLYLAREKMAEDETLLIESDLIFEDGIIQMAATSREPAVALVAKYEPWMDGTMVRMDAEGHVTGFVTKRDFHYEETHTYFKTVNVYKFSAKFSRERYIPFLEAYRQALGSNEYYEQVLRVIAFLDSTELRALPVGERKWYEIDDIQDLDIAEVIFSNKNDKLARYTKRYGGYWRFPYLL